MRRSTADIHATPERLTILIRKDEPLSGFQYLGVGIAAVGHLIILAFIWNSLASDGLPVMKFLFAVVGLFGLYNTNKQLRTVVLYSKGQDTIDVAGDGFRMVSRLGILRRADPVDLSKIKKVELLDGTDVPYGMSMVSPNAMKAGCIRVQWGWKKELHIGQFLGREELVGVYEELKRRIGDKVVFERRPQA